MKKILLFFFYLSLLPSWVLAQSSIASQLLSLEQVDHVDTLKSDCFKQKYLLYFTQPLSHADPNAGSFTQRVIIGHVGVDRPTVIVTEGYGASYAFRESYREELSKVLNANMIFVEHRYFLESTPQKLDWKYLTAENSANDLHQVRTALHSIYPLKWISTGISKGGQTTLIYKSFFPDDVDIAVPYVAPLCTGVEDGRHEPFLKMVADAQSRNRVKNFQIELLKRKKQLMPLFEAYCEIHDYSFNLSFPEIYDYSVLEFSFAFWQWGTPVTSIPKLNGTDQQLFSYFMKISDPGYFVKGGNNSSFFVQAARELGYYGYDITPFKAYLDIKTSKGYLAKMMLPEACKAIEFDATLSEKLISYLEENDPKMIFIYGENDPWTAAGVTWLKEKHNVHLFIDPNGSHLARISTFPKEQRDEIIALLNKWLSED